LSGSAFEPVLRGAVRARAQLRQLELSQQDVT
jgi:hypothetical protein